MSEYVTYPEDDYNRYEPSISLGGPIVKDKVWFFGAYQPALTKYERTVTPESAQNPDAASSVDDAQGSDPVHHREHDGADQQQPPHARRVQQQLGEAQGLAGQPERTRSRRAPTIRRRRSSRTGRFRATPTGCLRRSLSWACEAVTTTPTGTIRTSRMNRSTLWTTDEQYRVPGRSRVVAARDRLHQHPDEHWSDHDQQTRAFFHADGTVYANAGGEHQVKFGMQFDRTGNKVLSGESRPRVTLRGMRPCLRHQSTRRSRPLRVLLGTQQGSRPDERLHYRRATSTRTTWASSSRMRGR